MPAVAVDMILLLDLEIAGSQELTVEIIHSLVDVVFRHILVFFLTSGSARICHICASHGCSVGVERKIDGSPHNNVVSPS